MIAMLSTSGTNPSPPPNILAVDDEFQMRTVLLEVLTAAGYQVCAADSGEMALASVAANPPDLIMLDIRLKGISGIEVCRRLKADRNTRHIPIILISGFASLDERVEGLHLGAEDFLTKPFHPDELLARVKSHLTLSRMNLSLKQQAAAFREANEQLQAEIAKRQLVEDEMRQALDQAERSRQAMLSTLEDQKRTEEARRHLFDIVEKSINEIYVFDSETLQFKYANHGALSNLQYTLEEIKEKTAPEIKPDMTEETFRSLIQPLLANKEETLIFESVHRRADGSLYPVEVHLQLVEAGGNRLFLAVIFDISERKRSEEEKIKLQAQLNQAQKMEAIGVLAGGIAHDFNNILGVILGYAEMAREDVSPGSQYTKDLDKVLASAHRAKDLVKQILAFSRQSVVDRIPIKIQPMVKESLKMLRASIPTTITIKESIYPQGGVVLADPTQIHQIVMNLCTNAFHAMEKSGGVLSVSVKAASIDSSTPADGRNIPAGEYVLLTVSDTGVGMGPDTIDKIFDPYFTTKEIGKGTGMGLSITHGIIKGYGGEITVESALGQGTTVSVYFPVVQEEEMAVKEPQEAPRGKGRILFVDDEALLAEMGKAMLERLGYTVDTYNRSIEALVAFMNAPDQFDMVITDQTMPAMTGFDLAKRMLQIRPELPIILCTGFSHLVDEESAKAIGIRGFALKPLTKASIGQMIREILDGGPAV